MNGLQLRIRGRVQGVGFRPFLWCLATEMGLSGWVRNDAQGVTVAVAGANLEAFLTRLPREIPPLALIEDVVQRVLSDQEIVGLTTRFPGFEIVESEDPLSVAGVATTIGPDAAVCPACLAEMCDPANRRWRYPLSTCTHCGPRFTVSTGVPYDRLRTSLAPFPLCPDCATEYRNPADRRFHAETTCCPECGPQVSLLDRKGKVLPGDPLAETVRHLLAGDIVAIKGLGGFHLACDARDAVTVAKLRQRKHREAKPFAVMGLNPASLDRWVVLSPGVINHLTSSAAPIVLCPKRAAAVALVGIAPELAELGVMCPSTPLQFLIWHELAGRPAGTDWLATPSDFLLVMTSANPQGEPLVSEDAEALARLSGIADVFLTHNRPIVVRCDDSVVRVDDLTQSRQFIRRARGYVPVPIPLMRPAGSEERPLPTVLALGGHLKNTVCVLKGNEAFVSQHLGGLDNVASIVFQRETVEHWLKILGVKPDCIAHDLHPDYASTSFAQGLAAAWSIPAYAVPHHQAHLATIAAERGLAADGQKMMGLALDGVGLGPDGTAWGGELLCLTGNRCLRLGHLQPLALPGGDRAAQFPWRMAISALHQVGLSASVADWMARVWPERPVQEGLAILNLLERRRHCPQSSSLGRWFDAVAGLLGVCAENQYEGQAAMVLEAHAAAFGAESPLVGGWEIRQTASGVVLDLSPLLPVLLARLDNKAAGAALFHVTLSAALVDWITQTLAMHGEQSVTQIALAGGCALNRRLVNGLREQLAAQGQALLTANQVPPNDGGLALGQAWVAQRRWMED